MIYQVYLNNIAKSQKPQENDDKLAKRTISYNDQSAKGK